MNVLKKARQLAKVIPYISVKTMMQILNGENVEKRIDTGVNFVEQKDLDNPEFREIINPDIDKWLKLE